MGMSKLKIFKICLFFSMLSSCQNRINRVEKQAVGKKIIAPISIEGLRQRTYEATLQFEHQMRGNDKYAADVWSYCSDNLKVYTLVNTPSTPKPEKGFPVLIFGHGFHPNPPKYGFSMKTGENWRPGDYYRGIPEAYAEKGFLVITPDYRGHNTSEGLAFTKTSYLVSTYYAIDVLHLISALSSLKNADLTQIFYVGHSMGGDIGLKTILATKKIKAASLWSAVCASTWEQALYYGKYYDKNGEKTNPQTMKQYTAKLDSVVQNLGFKYNIDLSNPVNYVSDISTPIILHHGRRETSVPYSWSESFVAMLFKHQKAFEFYTYDTEDHLFQNAMRMQAVERDITFFEKYKK